MGAFKSAAAFDPEHPAKLYPTVTALTVSDDTVKLIGCPWDVVPLHWPLKVVDDGAVGPLSPPQAVTAMHRTHAVAARENRLMAGDRTSITPRTVPNETLDLTFDLCLLPFDLAHQRLEQR